MPYVISFDPASLKNLGVCVSDMSNGEMKIDRSFTSVFDVCINNKEKRLYDTKILLTNLIEQYVDIEAIVFERSMGFGMAFVRDQLSEQSGVMKLIAYEYKIPVVEISPKTAKLVITGSGKSDKKEVMKFVLEKFCMEKAELSSEHEADAIAIGYAYLRMKLEGRFDAGTIASKPKKRRKSTKK